MAAQRKPVVSHKGRGRLQPTSGLPNGGHLVLVLGAQTPATAHEVQHNENCEKRGGNESCCVHVISFDLLRVLSSGGECTDNPDDDRTKTDDVQCREQAQRQRKDELDAHFRRAFLGSLTAFGATGL